MKRQILISIIIITIAVALNTIPALAGGGKVRGDNGQGAVHQHMVVPPWWAR